MPGGLPQGLVSTKEVVSGEIERVDRVEAEDVQKLWKVYHSKKAALADNVGHRLDNFFWRIWSSRRIRDRITGTQVATQFSIINEGGEFRSTPTPSPRSSKNLDSYYRAARSRTLSSTSASQAPISPTESDCSPNPKEVEPSSLTPTPTSPLSVGTKGSSSSKENRSNPPIRPPPILKKSSSGSTSGSGGKFSKLATVSLASSSDARSSSIGENEEAVVLDDGPTPTRSTIVLPGRTATTRRSVTTRFNEEVAVSIPKTSTSVIRAAREKTGRSSSGESSQKSLKRNPVVVANTGASKRRPSLGRRKSSQTSSLPGSRTASYLNMARSPKDPISETKHTSRKDHEAPIEKRSRAVSPHPSKDKKPVSQDPQSSEESSDESDEEAGVRIRGPSRDTKGKRESTDDDDDGDDDENDDDASENSDNEKPGALKPLVDPNFRSKFIGKTRSAQGSFSNLPSLLRKSAAPAPVSASFQAVGMMDTSSTSRGKGREAYTNVVAPLKASPEAASDNDPQPLPRTKSQLTLLLEKERNRSANQEQMGRNPGES